MAHALADGAPPGVNDLAGWPEPVFYFACV